LPSDTSLIEALEKLETSYGKGKTKLSEITNNANVFVNADSDNAQQRCVYSLNSCNSFFLSDYYNNSSLLMLSVNTHEDDIWCIDPRGHLTLSVSKETYERLGLVGKKLPFKIHDDRHGAL
jgi:ribonuclease P/MRP protein subunit RPP40